MKFSSAAKVGLTAILLGFALIATFKGMGLRIPGLGTRNVGAYQINVSFISVKGLAAGADVQLNGNPIGEVKEITNDGFGGVLVKILIRGTQPIHDHAKFTITRDNIFGSYLVSIDELRAGRLSAPVVDDEATIRIQTGTVDRGGMVYSGTNPIGQILSVEPYDTHSDAVRIKVNPGTQLDDTMAFVPTRPRGTNLGGITIYNMLPPGTTVEGTREPGPEDLVADADKALAEIADQATLIMGQVGDLLDTFGGIIDEKQVQKLIETLSTEATLIANNVASLTGRLNGMLAQNEPHITQSLKNVEGITSDTQKLVAELSEYNNPEFRKKVNDIATNLTDATATLTKVLQDIESITGDKQTSDELKSTITQAKKTLEEAQTTLKTANKAFDKASSTVEGLGGVEASGKFTLKYAPDPNRFTGDLDAQIGMKKQDAFFTAGVHDIGETQRINAQVGWHFYRDASGRVGIHRGKIGIGADLKSDPFDFTTDIYDPNNITWDFYGGYAIIPELGIVVGIEDILGENEANLGLRFQF